VVPAAAGRVRSLAVAGAGVLDLPVAVADFPVALGAMLGTELAGVLGYTYLRQFLLTIDYPGETLVLGEPAPRADSR
jgi:hypothetical protein